MLSEGEGQQAAGAVRKRYVVTFEDVVKHLGWCDCDLCESDWNEKMQAKEVPDGTTHFYRARREGDVETWGVLEEIPK